MAADRRVLVLAVIAMVVLVGLGVGSAALMTGSACDTIVPDPVPRGPAGPADGVEQVLSEADGFDEELRGSVRDAIATLGARAGEPTGAAAVGDADALTTLDGRLVAAGATTSVLATDATTVRTRVAMGERAIVLGDGPSGYAAALTNDLTGQVDALAPIDVDLEIGDCLDTARVGIPLTFALDAGAGELLTFRVDEEAEEPRIELRDASAGARWTTDLEVPTAPPGVAAERLSSSLTDGAAVLATDGAGEDAGDDAAADRRAPGAWALDRNDGELRWELDVTTARGLAPEGDQPLELEVLDADDELALVAITRDRPGQTGALVALDVDDGQRVWTADLGDGDPLPVAATPDDTGAAVVTIDDGAGVLSEVDLTDGTSVPLAGVSGAEPTLARTGSTTVVGTDQGATVVRGDQGGFVELGTTVRDVLALPGGGVAMLLGDDDAAVVATFGA